MSDELDLSARVLSWVETLRETDGPYGKYKMSRKSDATPFTSCFACFIRHLFNDMNRLSTNQREEWLNHLLSYQDPKTGLFIDRDIPNRGLTAGHNWQYVTWQLTSFCISAIDVLGGRLKYPLCFLEYDGFLDSKRLCEWLMSLNWNNPWGCGNLAMFMGVMLIKDYEMRNDEKSLNAINAFFNWHDQYQNPKTGFWGKRKVSEYHNGLFGAYHQYLLYWYVGRDLNYKEAIIDRILSFQNIDGMFSPQMGGGGCEDIDAIDTLVQLYLQTGYREADVKQCLQRAYDAVCSLEAPDGGFIWGIRKRYGPMMYLHYVLSFRHQRDWYEWIFMNRRFIRQQVNPRKPRHLEGWVKQAIPINESDLFSTWFRLLAIAYCSMILQTPHSSIPWHFLDTPGLGSCKPSMDFCKRILK